MDFRFFSPLRLRFRFTIGSTIRFSFRTEADRTLIDCIVHHVLNNTGKLLAERLDRDVQNLISQSVEDVRGSLFHGTACLEPANILQPCVDRVQLRVKSNILQPSIATAIERGESQPRSRPPSLPPTMAGGEQESEYLQLPLSITSGVDENRKADVDKNCIPAAQREEDTSGCSLM